MKMLQRGLILSACGLLALGFVAKAQAANETFNVTTWFGVSKCTKVANPRGEPKTDCKLASEAKPTDVTIKIENCHAGPEGSSQACSGTWTGMQTVEGHSFNGTVMVSKNTDSAGKISYSVLSQTEQKDVADTSSIHLLLLAKQTLTDSSISFGRSLVAKSSTGEDVTYIPILAVGAKGSLSLDESRLLY